MKKINTKNNKNLTVELLRVINCIFVVWAHQCIGPVLEDGSISELYIIFECIFYKSVVVFFIITGFYMYDMTDNIWNDWLHMIKKLIIDVWIPSILVVMFCIIFDDFIQYKSTFISCLSNINIDNIKLLFEGIIARDPVVWGEPCAYLWYIFSYSYIIIFYPIIRFILNMNKKILYMILILYGALQISNDILVFYNIWDINFILTIIPRPIYYSICGYVLYKNILVKLINNKKDFIKNSNILIFSILIYIISFVIMYIMRYMYLTNVGTIYQHSSYYGFVCLVEALSVVAIFFNINFDKYINEKISDIIKKIGKYTFGIYIVHYPITFYLARSGFRNIFLNNLYTIFHWVGYFLIYGSIVFLLALIVVIICGYIVNIIKNQYNKIFNN